MTIFWCISGVSSNVVAGVLRYVCLCHLPACVFITDPLGSRLRPVFRVGGVERGGGVADRVGHSSTDRERAVEQHLATRLTNGQPGYKLLLLKSVPKRSGARLEVHLLPHDAMQSPANCQVT